MRQHYLSCGSRDIRPRINWNVKTYNAMRDDFRSCTTLFNHHLCFVMSLFKGSSHLGILWRNIHKRPKQYTLLLTSLNKKLQRIFQCITVFEPMHHGFRPMHHGFRSMHHSFQLLAILTLFSCSPKDVCQGLTYGSAQAICPVQRPSSSSISTLFPNPQPTLDTTIWRFYILPLPSM